MADDMNMPGVDKPAEAVAESAKFGRSVVEVVAAGGEWASAVLGTLPHNAVGILADEVATYRTLRAISLRQKVVQRLKEQGYEKPEDLNAPPSLLLPILEQAVDENSAILQDLWVKLLASASVPEKRTFVRRSFIEIVKSLDPVDALVLQLAPTWIVKFQPHEHIAKVLKIDQDEAAVSMSRLREIGLLDGKGGGMKSGSTESSGYHISPVGRLFLKAVSI